MNTIYTMALFRRKTDGTYSNAVKHFDDHTTALKSYFTNISTNIENSEYDYVAVYLIRSDGVMIEGRVFDNRTSEEG